MPNDCVDPNLPVVDNTTLECEDIIPTNCVVTSESDLYFQVAQGRDLTYWMTRVRTYVQQLNTALSAILPTSMSYSDACTVEFLGSDGVPFYFKRSPTHTASLTEPVDNCLGDTWLDMNTDTLFMRINDGTIDVWRQISV